LRQTHLQTKIEFLKGVGPEKAKLLQSELNVFVWGDLLNHFPFRYIDKTKQHFIKDIFSDGQQVLLKGTLLDKKLIKGKRAKRLVAMFKDSTGFIELVWFQGASWIEKALQEGVEYIVFGKVSVYKGKKTIAHPEIELTQSPEGKQIVQSKMDPVYHSTEKLNARGLDSKARKRMVKSILVKLTEQDLPENLDQKIINKLKLCSRYKAMRWIHFPTDELSLRAAQNRIKFEEIFFSQLKMLYAKNIRESKMNGWVFEKVGDKFSTFFNTKLSFELTGAQKKVIKEIRKDLGSGVHMNRLLQGDVGSGKTIVGLMCMLLAIDNGFQAALLAPTEILAQQHYSSITEMLDGLQLNVGFLSGSVKGKKRKELLKLVASGDIHILIGTHAILEDPVIFKNIGLAITDEQHRFGVMQRARLWEKNTTKPPHILVMTATPIPRTLAMTVYGDLDVSIIDELPPGRKPVTTVHNTEARRPEVLEFMHKEIEKGRQIYVVFPLIEESAKLDLQNLQTGYEQLEHFFPKSDFQISVVHGRMKPKDKDFEMQRFVKGKTNIMVATTVIEVGVNVPNASIMIIENAERFGLSQLHQLRGRVGRGAEQSYCILMTSYKLSKEAKTRIKTMCSTNNGFEIAEADMKLRGHGDIQGTQQSGVAAFNLLSLVADQEIIKTARIIVQHILKEDPELTNESNAIICKQLDVIRQRTIDLGNIS